MSDPARNLSIMHRLDTGLWMPLSQSVGSALIFCKERDVGSNNCNLAQNRLQQQQQQQKQKQ